MNGKRKYGFSGIFLVVLMLLLLYYLFAGMRSSGDISYAQLRQLFQQEQVQSFVIRDTRITADLKDGTTATCDLYSFDLFYDDLNELVEQQSASGIITDYNYHADHSTNWLQLLLPYVLAILAFILLMNLMARNAGGGMDSKMARFGEARVQTPGEGDKKTTFRDVAGADEEKEELQEIVEFLRDPEKYLSLGAHIPKGVLLVGPPGTGKTLLARAVAGEAGVKFLSISGSDFVELYVGVGASRVRDLFDQAKKDSPAIVFIDEIDAVGRQRGAGLGGGHDEREQTLNQLLVEMDGFSANEGVIVLAATNRVDILDPALLRPGRFDRQVYVGYPDIKGREAILKIHARNKPLADDVSLAELAKATGGFTGADLENLMNEAALLAARREERFITMEDLHEAVIKVIAGPEKKSKVVTPRERRLTAYHEAGHAVVNHSLETADPVHQITIVPRGGAGGMTISLPQEDKNFLSRTELTERIASLLGGRVAEQLTLGDISTGAGNDIQRASSIARNMVMRYGMSDRLGSVTFDTGHDEVFIGRSMAQAKSYSEEVAGIIDEEVKTLIDNAYARCESILKAHAKELDLVARYLLEHETMDAKTFEQVFTDPASLQAQLPADGDGDSASDPWPEPGNGDA